MVGALRARVVTWRAMKSLVASACPWAGDFVPSATGRRISGGGTVGDASHLALSAAWLSIHNGEILQSGEVNNAPKTG